MNNHIGSFPKYLIYILGSLFILIFAYLEIKVLHYNEPAKNRHPYRITNNHTDTIKIGYIGDSWAELHMKHPCQIAEAIKNTINRPVIMESFGISGFTSKEIYNSFFDNVNFKVFLEEGFDYCVISAGINDTNQKRSPLYYTNSMDCIIQFMLSNKIHPIIIEIPDYDIDKAYEIQKKYKMFLRDIYMYITGYPKNCKDIFRKSLSDLIEKKGYGNKVSIIRYKSWNNNYRKDISTLYQDDGVHLNNTGYNKLDHQIAQTICEIIIANK